ncbi:hypothetical protein EIP91_009153 [Steccherinum ochraceum]|uniref:Uncharacterized protein n=1 Tax=Steccherinum ochraceum TaxID=92696 RepID=A0A4R0RF24_9APHY|nr:hypothetical protein EIP91_009153 [Steccherinum ochraceum]
MASTPQPHRSHSQPHISATHPQAVGSPSPPFYYGNAYPPMLANGMVSMTAHPHATGPLGTPDFHHNLQLGPGGVPHTQMVTMPAHTVDSLFSTLDAMQNRVEALEGQVKTVAEKRPHPNGPSNTNSGSDSDSPHATRATRKKRRTKFILATKVEDLTLPQVEVRQKLQSHIHAALCMITGTKPNETPGRGRRRRTRRTTLTASSGSDADTENDEDVAPTGPGIHTGGDGTTNTTNRSTGNVEHWKWDFTKDTDQDINALIVTRAAKIVWEEQTDPNRRDLPFTNVLFNIFDLESFAKEKFRVQRKSHRKKTDPEFAKRVELQVIATRRAARRSWLTELVGAVQLAEDRLEAAPKYYKQTGRDVRKLCKPEYMSDSLSGPEEGDEAARQHFLVKLQDAARLSRDMRAQTELWAVQRPAYRDAKITEVMQDLDKIRQKQRKKEKRAQWPTPRIDIDLIHNRPPTERLYKFTISSTWWDQYCTNFPQDAADMKMSLTVLPGFADAGAGASAAGVAGSSAERNTTGNARSDEPEQTVPGDQSRNE